MPAQNLAASRMFRANSAKLRREQKTQPKAVSQDIPEPKKTSLKQKESPKRLEKGDYGGLRLETAEIQGKGQHQDKPQIEEGKLSFARDRKKQAIENAAQKRELKDGELSFSRSRSGQDLSRER